MLGEDARTFDYPRAYALSVTSIEEQVKALTYKCIAMGLLKPEDLRPRKNVRYRDMEDDWSNILFPHYQVTKMN